MSTSDGCPTTDDRWISQKQACTNIWSDMLTLYCIGRLICHLLIMWVACAIGRQGDKTTLPFSDDDVVEGIWCLVDAPKGIDPIYPYLFVSLFSSVSLKMQTHSHKLEGKDSLGCPCGSGVTVLWR